MRRLLSIGLVLLVILLAGCGSPVVDDQTPATGPEMTDTPETTPTPEADQTPTSEAEDDAADTDGGADTPDSDDGEVEDTAGSDTDSDTADSDSDTDDGAGDSDRTDASDSAGDSDRTDDTADTDEGGGDGDEADGSGTDGESDGSGTDGESDGSGTDGESDGSGTDDRTDGDDSTANETEDGDGADDTDGGAGTVTRLDDCTTIDEPGEYVLTEDLDERSEEVCIEITVGDVILDGDGYLIEGVGSDDTVGVDVLAPGDRSVENVTVRDVRARAWGTGMAVGETARAASTHVSFENVRATENEGDGIVVTGFASAEFEDVTASRNGGTGINGFDGLLNRLDNVTANGNGGAGISGYDSGEIDVDGVTVSRNDGAGLSFGDPTELRGTELTVTENGGAGISLGVESFLNVSDARVAGNDGVGISAGDTGVTVRDSVVENNGDSGVRLSFANGTFRDTTIRGNDGWEVETGDGSPVTASNLDVGDSATFDFDEEPVSLDVVPEDDLPALPENAESAGSGVEVDGIDDTVSMTLEYGDAADAEAVGLWRHDGREWRSESAQNDGEQNALVADLTRGAVYAPVESDEDPGPSQVIDSCSTIDEPGTYEVTQDLVDRDAQVCIAVEASDVTIEGNGNTIGGTGADESIGVRVDHPTESELENVTIRDLEVTDWWEGVVVGRSEDSSIQVTLTDVRVHDTRWNTIGLEGTTDSRLENVTATGNRILIEASSDLVVEDVRIEDGGLSLMEAQDAEVTGLTSVGAGGTGLLVGSVERGEFSDLYLANNDAPGLSSISSASSDITVRDSVIEDNAAQGIVYRRVPEDAHTLNNVTVRNNGDAEIDAREGLLSATDLDVGDSATFEFEEASVSLDSVPEEELPNTPEEADTVGDGVDVAGVDDSVSVALDYDEDRVEGEEVELWRHDGAEWRSEESYDAAAADGTLTADLSEDGVYAPVEADGRDENGGGGEADGGGETDGE